LDKELQQYYEARFGMMSTKGYTDLLADVEVMIEERNNLMATTTALRSYTFVKVS